MVITLVGKNNPVLAMELMGWVVSIPVFCDSGFVILNPIRKALVQRTKESSVAMTVSHANDSYFWVVTNFGAMSPERGYKTHTVNTLVMGIAAIAEIALLSLFIH